MVVHYLKPGILVFQGKAVDQSYAYAAQSQTVLVEQLWDRAHSSVPLF